MTTEATRRMVAGAIATALIAALSAAPLRAHSGPPFPIVETRVAGPYELSVWTDPDTTDDGSPGGQFWITLRAASGAAVPSDTRVSVTITPTDRPGAALDAIAAPIENEPTRRFAALVMDHEGRFHVRVSVNGALGEASVEGDVDATYDLRPSFITIGFVLIPFVMVGFLWLKALRSGPRTRRPPSA